MKRTSLICISLGLLAIGGTRLLASSPGGVPSLTPAQKAVRDAASMKDPQMRQDQLRQAIREGLISPDRAVRDQVFSYISANTRWIDLAPYSDVIEEFAKTDSQRRGLWLLDDVELAHAPRAERLATYRSAIESGSVRLKRGGPLTRETASALAASEGMTELQPLVERLSPLVDERWKKSFQFEAFPILFDLSAGASDYDDGLKRSAEKLAEMRDTEFATKMDGDLGFRAAVFRIARDVCTMNPFSGWRNPGCSKMEGLIARQSALEKKSRVPADAVATLSPETETGRDGDGWLAQLKERIPLQ